MPGADVWQDRDVPNNVDLRAWLGSKILQPDGWWRSLDGVAVRVVAERVVEVRRTPPAAKRTNTTTKETS